MNEPKLLLEELNNGMQILTVNNPTSLSIIVYFYFNVGSSNETSEINGVSHFIEHMLYKGTKKYPNTKDIDDIMSGHGITYNAFTNKKKTCYHFKFLSNETTLNIVCDVANELLFHSLFRSSDIEKERDVIIQEYNAFQNNPAHVFYNLVESTYFKGSSLEPTVLGTPQSLNNIHRKELMTYHKIHYKPENLLIIIGGNIPENSTSVITKHFNTSVCSRQSPYKKMNNIITQPFISTYASLDNEIFIERKIAQNFITMIFPTEGMYDERRFKFVILNDILSARLFIKIRDKLGLVYGISASLNNYCEGGFLSIDFQTDNKKTRPCIDAVKLELQKVMKHGFKEDEFKRSLINIKSKFIMSMEINDDMTDFYGSQILYFPKIKSFAEFMKLINEVTLEQVNILASSILTDFKIIISGKK
jgi:predicted Zn-dependent peptidase